MEDMVGFVHDACLQDAGLHSGPETDEATAVLQGEAAADRTEHNIIQN